MSSCRICLCCKPRKDVSELHVCENRNKQCYKDIIMFCLGIKITEGSNKSTKLCVKCYRKIIKFYEFKVLAHKNDEYLRSSLIENGVFFIKDDEDIKAEKETENSDIYIDDEPVMLQIKNEDFDFDAQNNENDNISEFKYEYKEESHSDDEFLSVIKNLKSESAEVVIENAPVQKKKRIKMKIPKEMRLETKKSKGIFEGVCEHCGKVYKDLTAHVRLRHSQRERKRVPCEHCDKTFANNVYKRRHVQRKHLNVKQTCTLCARAVANLNMHMRTIHEKDSLPFKCVHCDLKFLTQSRLKLHTTIHTKDRPFECNICGSTFRLKLSLNNHIRQVHNKERSHLCQFCSKSFFKKHHLVIHLRSHTNEKPYPCPDCGKFYQTSTSLKNHRLIHSAEKKVSCTMCDASFINRSYLSNHMMSHIKEKRYPCQYCNVRFHRSDHRKRHEYTAHLKHTGGVMEVPRSYTPQKRTTATAAVTSRSKLFDDECEESTASTAPSV